MIKHLVRFSVLAFLLALSNLSYAAVPHLINYQGRLTDTSGTPLNGSYSVTFRIYDAETAGSMLWEETHTGVVIQKGIFSVLLGSVTNLGLAFDKQYYLEIKVGTEVMTPRQRITSAGYAMRAEKADTLDVSSAQQGDILYYNGTIWTKLSAGNSGQYLKTQGIGATPAWSNIPGIPNNIQVFTSSGTWIKPSNVSKVYVKVWGGGGGGSNGNQNTGGGGSGGYAEGLVSVSGNVVITVGTGGVAQNGNGGDSVFAGDVIVRANGGGSGNPGGFAGSGVGGGASGGYVNIPGNSGSGSTGGDAPFGGPGGQVVNRGGTVPGGGGANTSNGAAGMVIVYW